jgi:hypothetical protein
MGLCGPAFDIIGREHAYRPITGDILFIGRQTTYFTVEDLTERMGRYGHSVDVGVIEFDRSTVNRNDAGEFVTDRSIFRALGLPPERIKALDVSPYEGAEVIHDLNQPLPPRLRGTADFLIDGSTLDNVFDPAQALRNFDALLRPGGRMLLMNAWNQRDSAYTLCSAAWFFDFFVANGYADCKVYLCALADQGGNIYWLDPRYMHERMTTPVAVSGGLRPFFVVFAEKSRNPPPPSVPTQSHYRSDKEWDHYRQNLQAILASSRPHLAHSVGNLPPPPVLDGFRWIDWSFADRGVEDLPSSPKP